MIDIEKSSTSSKQEMSHEHDHRQHTAGRRFSHAGRVRAPRPDLDALAAAPRQLAARRQAGAARLGGGGHGHPAFEPVTVGVNHGQYENARNLLPAAVRVVELSSNDAWVRDCGPTFVVNDKGDVRLVDWEFNAWGGLYDGLYFPWDLDQMIPLKIAEMERVERYKAPLVLEGGSIHVDGEGTVITTEECLLSPGRNPQLGREQIEGYLRDYLNVEQGGLAGPRHRPRRDQRPRRRRRLLRQAGRGPRGCDRRQRRLALRAPSGEPATACRQATDAKGRKLEIHTVPMPAIMEITADEAWGVDSAEGSIPRQPGDKTAASYLNFLIVNGGVIMPVFDDPNDAVVKASWRRCSPSAGS